MTQAEVERALQRFEGLVHRTAQQIVASGVELEFDDVRQLLRIKVWHAVQAFDENKARSAKHLSHQRDRRGRTPLERFVFLCVANMRKDIEKRPRRFNSSIEDLRTRKGAHFLDDWSADDWFDGRFLSVDAEEVFAEIEEEEFELPPTLTRIERQLVLLRLNGRMLLEIDRELGLSRAQRERVLESIREKLAHLRPEGARSAPMPPLPDAELQAAPARAPLAA